MGRRVSRERAKEDQKKPGDAKDGIRGPRIMRILASGGD
jgi:hypothetical protein